jgi:trehalose 6-phosphate phosphatase
MQMPGVVYIGNHGLERCVDRQVRYNIDVEKYRPMFEACLKDLREIRLPGVQVEDKGVTVTLHYRQTQDPQKARDALLPRVQEIAAGRNLDFFEGRMIFELRPPIKVNKGTAFESLMHEFSLEGAIYVGDDTTDISALKIARRMRQSEKCYALGVGVISDSSPESLPSEADLLVFGVPEVEDLLAWLLENLG